MPAKHAKAAKGEGKRPFFYRTEIRVEISAPDAELVSALRDQVEQLLGHYTGRVIEKNQGKLLCFTTRTCAAIPEGMSLPFDRKETKA